MFVIFIFREVRARAPPSANATGQKWPYRTLLGCVWGGLMDLKLPGGSLNYSRLGERIQKPAPTSVPQPPT